MNRETEREREKKRERERRRGRRNGWSEGQLIFFFFAVNICSRQKTITMVSDQEIARGVETLLRQSDPNAVTTLNGVVDQLGARLGLNLSHKADFIRDQINLLLRSQPQPVPPKDHFALQHQHQFQPQFHPHFALQQLQHHQQQQLQLQQQHLHRQQQEELGFRNPTPPQPTQPRQVQRPPPVKVEPNVVQDATAANSSETLKDWYFSPLSLNLRLCFWAVLGLGLQVGFIECCMLII